jgi:DNA primase
LPLNLISIDHPEGAALRAIADDLDHGALPSGGIGQLLEHFRGSEHETTLAAYVGQLTEDEFDEAAMEEEFSDAVERLRQTSLTRSISELSERGPNLSSEERRSLAGLLAEKAAADAGRRLK